MLADILDELAKRFAHSSLKTLKDGDGEREGDVVDEHDRPIGQFKEINRVSGGGVDLHDDLFPKHDDHAESTDDDDWFMDGHADDDDGDEDDSDHSDETDSRNEQEMARLREGEERLRREHPDIHAKCFGGRVTR